jgi:hypothetical protein
LPNVQTAPVEIDFTIYLGGPEQANWTPAKDGKMALRNLPSRVAGHPAGRL